MGVLKIVIPLSSHVTQLLATNAVHDEYLSDGAGGGFLALGLLITLAALWALHGSRPLRPTQTLPHTDCFCCIFFAVRRR